jgi:hypothetical protein
MPGQSGNLDDTGISGLLGNYSSDRGLFLLGSDNDDGESDSKVRNLEATIRTMSENEDLDDTDWENRYVLQWVFF